MSDAKNNTRSFESLSKLWDAAKSLSGVLVFSMSGVATIAVAVTTARTEIEHRIDKIETLHESDIKILATRLDELESAVKHHHAMGIDGVPHPQGVIVALEKLGREADAKSRDRWTKQDHTDWLITDLLPRFSMIEKRLDKLEP